MFQKASAEAGIEGEQHICLGHERLLAAKSPAQADRRDMAAGSRVPLKLSLRRQVGGLDFNRLLLLPILGVETDRDRVGARGDIPAPPGFVEPRQKPDQCLLSRVAPRRVASRGAPSRQAKPRNASNVAGRAN